MIKDLLLWLTCQFKNLKIKSLWQSFFFWLLMSKYFFFLGTKEMTNDVTQQPSFRTEGKKDVKKNREGNSNFCCLSLTGYLFGGLLLRLTTCLYL